MRRALMARASFADSQKSSTQGDQNNVVSQAVSL